MKRLLAYLLTILLLSACGAQSPGAAGSSATPTPAQLNAQITLERTRCFGTCPVYKLTIKGDGSVTYEGEQFVKQMGTRQGSISQAQLRQLLEKAESIRYFDLQSDYSDYNVTDMPSAMTSVQWDARQHAINHYHGDKSAPADLEAFEDLIDSVTNSAQWIK